MKEVLSVFTFGIGALCFVVFVTVLKPNAISAVPLPDSMHLGVPVMGQFCVLLTTRDPKLKRGRREMAGFYAPRRIAAAA
jgi:hypothetical protein